MSDNFSKTNYNNQNQDWIIEFVLEKLKSLSISIDKEKDI